MKIAQINILPNGSTGKIMLQIAETARESGHVAKTFTPIMFSRIRKEKKLQLDDHYEFGTFFENGIHYYAGTLLGANGMFSFHGTKQLIAELQEFQPDILHIHNIHGFCVNLPMLFRYIKQSKVHVVWTFHDCWPFTGHCPCFSMVKCERWKEECYHCPQPRVYPKMYLDTSKWMYHKKKEWFQGVPSMTIVTPSLWLADLVKQSFLRDYPVMVINNGIDRSVFKPTENHFREQHGILENKKILLGVAFDWGRRKGLDVFIKLALSLDETYQIVLVGTNDSVDKQLPENIISIHRTNNQTELAQIYTAADLFINPTREDNYPTVNMEAISCGTPVLTFRTGGSPEIVDGTCGCVVDCDDVDGLMTQIEKISNENLYTEEMCLKKSKEFDKMDKFKEYIDLYENIVRGGV